jgi:hypothetical protein
LYFSVFRILEIYELFKNSFKSFNIISIFEKM